MLDHTSAAAALTVPWPLGSVTFPDPTGEVPCLLGPSAAAATLRAVLGPFSVSRSPLLLRGATGTGKLAVAQELHRRSDRGGEPFGVIDFAAADEAKTKRAARRLAQVAAGELSGTWYIPELSTFSGSQQNTLASALAASGTRTRLIVGSSAEVDRLFTVGRLSSELASMLTVSLALPLLRDRLEDVAAIAECCVQRWSRPTGDPAPRIRGSAIDRLKAYAWPRNVRELEDVVVTACGRAGGRPITAEAVDAALGRRPRRSVGEDVVALRDMAQSYILVAVARCGYNHSLAARRLGIGRNTLLRKLRECPHAEASLGGRLDAEDEFEAAGARA